MPGAAFRSGGAKLASTALRRESQQRIEAHQLRDVCVFVVMMCRKVPDRPRRSSRRSPPRPNALTGAAPHGAPRRSGSSRSGTLRAEFGAARAVRRRPDLRASECRDRYALRRALRRLRARSARRPLRRHAQRYASPACAQTRTHLRIVLPESVPHRRPGRWRRRRDPAALLRMRAVRIALSAPKLRVRSSMSSTSDRSATHSNASRIADTHARTSICGLKKPPNRRRDEYLGMRDILRYRVLDVLRGQTAIVGRLSKRAAHRGERHQESLESPRSDTHLPGPRDRRPPPAVRRCAIRRNVSATPCRLRQVYEGARAQCPLQMAVQLDFWDATQEFDGRYHVYDRSPRRGVEQSGSSSGS